MTTTSTTMSRELTATELQQAGGGGKMLLMPILSQGPASGGTAKP